ncbi:UNVERIFIED_CONTAM: hypothetical protein Sangu_1304400 [Sesamum angustifolium]|uniref:Hydroxyproline-rich glycoprotein family protein n=1 Tax=Sesamum angustifolium TaxID=2727405 RepID=A0AAW2NMN8_9LAMI
MKSPLGTLRKFGLTKNEPKEKWDHKISVHIDGLTQAAKDMKDMRTCYDSLLSAAAATANSAYEFSESLLEMGNCLLEKTAMHDDGESGEFLSNFQCPLAAMLNYPICQRSHIIMTITNPSESLLSELRKVEEMKLQCDEKREMFEYMVGQFREKGKSRHGKGETFTSQQLQVVCDEYDDVARLCIFRVESLKQGQSRSLLTQAARHHAAQLIFFRKGLQSLEAVEPHIRNVAEKQHIDYELSELNEVEKGDDEGNSFETNDYGELSFDYRQNKQELDNACTSRNSMELTWGPVSWDMQLDQLGAPSAQTPKVKDVEVHMGSSKSQGDEILSQRSRAGSHSAPIYPEKFDPSDRIREMRTAVQKLNTHVLPTPADAKGSVPSISGGFDTRKIKRQAFSGPLASKPSSNKPLLPTSGPISSTGAPQSVSGLLSRASGPQAPSLVNVSHNASPPLVSSPKISELHELPRPPDSFSSKPMRSVVALGHSAPLVNRNREVSPTNRNPSRQSKEGSPLPLPQLTVSRSFSIPSSSQRASALPSGKLLESSEIVQKAEEVASPPLTPISLSNMKPPNSGQIRGEVNTVIMVVSSSA